jgi:hypothetical protein
MPERTIDWGGSSSPYVTYVDRDGNDRAVILDDGTTIFLEKDASDTWQFGSAVDLNTNDLSAVGALDATSASVTNEVDAGSVSTDELVGMEIVNNGDTIQGAHDNLPASGGAVFISRDYDDSAESFPISVDKPISIRGESNQSVQLDGGTSDVFAVDGAANYVGQRFGYFELRDIGITGGNRGILIENAAFSRVQDVIIDGVSDHGILFSFDTNSTNSALLKRVEAVNCGSDGFRLGTGAKAHQTAFINCVADKNTNEGLHVRDGRAVGVFGGQYQQNGDRGLRVEGGTVYVYGPYVEENSSNDNIDILLDGGEGHTIFGAYCNGVGANERAVFINGAEAASVQNLVGTGYTGGLLTTNTGTDNDLHLDSHVTLDNTPVLQSSSATRDRSNGVIGGHQLGGVDLSTTTGQYDGDLAVADGTSAASTGAWARWDESASVWQYVDPSGTV